MSTENQPEWEKQVDEITTWGRFDNNLGRAVNSEKLKSFIRSFASQLLDEAFEDIEDASPTQIAAQKAAVKSKYGL